MSEWAAKRFWTKASATPCDGGFQIELDGRMVRTPAKTPLRVPTQDMAEAIAAEWDAQGEVLDPLSMPVTRSANAALDKVAPQRAEVVDLIAAYGGSDMLCYRAEGPEPLVARQAAAWDPYLDWSARELGAPLVTTAGLMHVTQPAESLSRLHKAVAAFDTFELAGLHDLVSLSGSLVLGLSVAAEPVTASNVWPITRLDELWQQEQWGADEEAESMAAIKAQDFLHAARFLRLARGETAPFA